MRFAIILFFIFITRVESAGAQARRSLAPQIAKVTSIINTLKKNNGDSARIAFYERMLSEMKFTQAYLDKIDISKLKKPKKVAGSTWSGTLSMETVTTHKNEVYVGQGVQKILVSFNGARPTMNRENDDPDLNFTDNKGTGTNYSHGEITEVLVKRKCIGDCTGTGEAELHSVIIREWDNTYDIEAIGPSCHGTSNCKEPWDEDKPTITVSNQPLINKNLLQGSKTVTAPMPMNLGTGTNTITWNLSRDEPGDELIVIPEDYDTWLPQPGKDENDPGRLMVIRFKVIGKNGQAPNLKVDHFELKLTNTSKEPGICLNMPLKVGAILPDIRFDDVLNENTSPDGQTATALSYDGVTGGAIVNSYDGGGYTTFSVVAIMEDNSKLQGHLRIPGGESAIPIPKRPPGSNIGDAWLAANKNPRDADDLETSPGNNYNGDGLSAYEEYRGVIAHGGFERLDPNKKELAVKTADWQLFGLGIAKFEVASGIIVVTFFENEIGADRRLNKNKQSAHIYDQYAIHLKLGSLPNALGNSFGGPGIPKQISSTVIDQNRIYSSYQDRVAEAKSINQPLGYTEKDLFATITAHELAHSAGVKHHGSLAPNSVNQKIEEGRPVHIFDHTGAEIKDRPFTITGRLGDIGNEQSGNVDCFMLNNALCDWAVKTTPDSMFFYEVPLIPLGTKLCTSKDGTGLNGKKDANGNHIYFGDAVNGDCLSQIKLK